MLLLFFAFLSGLATILAPCIWPILPIVLSASVGGGHKKPLGIVLGIGVSFTVFTLALSYILKVIPFDPNALRLFAVVVIGLLGLTLVIPALGKILEGWVSRLSAFGGRFTGNQGSGFVGGFVTGAALGLLWSPCAGPILATVAAVAATQSVNLQIILLTLSFVLGVIIPLFILAFLGQKIFTKSRALNPYLPSIQRFFGLVMIVAAIAIYTGYDQVLQTKLIEKFPACGVLVNGLENNSTLQKELEKLRGGVTSGTSGVIDQVKNFVKAGDLPKLGQASEFAGVTTWLNTEGKPLKLSDLKGKVVLVDFWTYSCINCIRTLPYLTSWYEKYKDEGFVIVGVHTPEFAFEKKQSNVEEAIERYNIHYPVALDNDFATWNAYSNQYWPAHYLVDVEGNIRERHFGEGNYTETEKAIQSLIKEAGMVTADHALTEEGGEENGRGLTPETYLGAARMERFLSPEPVVTGEQSYTIPPSLTKHAFAFDGKWTVEREKALTGSPAALNLHFNARKVFLVLSPAEGKVPSRVSVFLDGKKIMADSSGKDVQSGVLTLDTERLYELVNLPDNAPNDRTLRLEFETPRIAAYAFTFGG